MHTRKNLPKDGSYPVKALLLLLGGIVLFTSVALAETDSSDTAVSDKAAIKSLAEQYDDRIARLKLEIRNESERRTTILDQLDKVISEITALEDKSIETAKSTPTITDSLQQTTTDIKTLEEEIQHNDALLKQIQASLDQQPELSIWQAALGKPEVKTQQTLLATQSYLLHTARKRHRQLEDHKARLNTRYQALLQHGESVASSMDEMKAHFDQLVQKRQKLESQLTDIAAQIVARQDRKSLLEARHEQILSNPDALQFSSLQSKLRDPVEGRIIRQFAQPKAKGLLKWKGILVEAPLGLPFTAVADGTVVFADKLQGLGNVAILDHGQGYMTLYGMAELLLVEKDQWLLAGDPVGTVGESVGTDTSALYFEVRHNADAVNPQDWLQMHQISQKNAL